MKSRVYVVAGCLILFLLSPSFLPISSMRNTDEVYFELQQEIENKYGSVTLDAVNPPVYGEEFFKINECSVTWGVGDICIVADSGFPGFGYPILVTGYTAGESEVIVQTTYGTYEYTLINESPAFLVDGVLVSNTGEPLVDFTRKQEKLFIFNDNFVEVFELKCGTQIVKKQ